MKNKKYLPAMLSIGRDKYGNTQCVQVTYLCTKTANKADAVIQKRTYASPSGALVSLQKTKNWSSQKNKISFIAEGTETGLSVKDAMGAIKNSSVVVTLGKSNFTNIDPNSVGDKVVFCLDNDGLKTFTDDTIHKAAKRLIEFGKEVFIAVPKTSEKNGKIDFNDIVKTAGIDTVKNTIGNSVPYKEWVSVRGIEINSGVVEKVMQQKGPYLKSYDPLPKKPEINLTAAAKFIDSEKKNFFEKYPNTHNHMQQDLLKQKNIDTPKILNIPNTQKDLSKIEKELY